MTEEEYAELYTEDYFVTVVDYYAAKAAPTIAASISELFQSPGFVVDVGCGTGAMLEAFQKLGWYVTGLEKSLIARGMAALKGVPAFEFDLETDEYVFSNMFHLALCLEVAEHLAEEAAPRLVNLLTRLAPFIVFSAARPNQGGNGHLNEKPKHWWIDLFHGAGFDCDQSLTKRIAEKWRAGDVEWFYYENVMVFRKRA